MIVAIIVLIIGFIVLVWSADRLVDGASQLALGFGVSAMTIGLTIVALGTSLPEIVVSFVAVINGHTSMAIGNVVGSNIANIALVLGITLLIVPVNPKRSIVWREFPLLFVVMLFFSVLMFDGRLGRVDGLLMIIVIVMVLYFIFKRKKPDVVESEQKNPPVLFMRAWIWFFVGVIFLPLSSFFIVKSAVYIAEYFHVSDLIIGLTILALGTSLPELATCIVGARKKQYDLVMGNIIGSNIFNLLAVLALPILIKPIAVDNIVFQRDLPVMLVISLILIVLLIIGKRGRALGKLDGVLLVAMYVGYLVWVIV